MNTDRQPRRGPALRDVVTHSTIPVTTYIATAESLFLDTTPPVKPNESNKTKPKRSPFGCPHLLTRQFQPKRVARVRRQENKIMSKDLVPDHPAVGGIVGGRSPARREAFGYILATSRTAQLCTWPVRMSRESVGTSILNVDCQSSA
jgi:hypothetical protein